MFPASQIFRSSQADPMREPPSHTIHRDFSLSRAERADIFTLEANINPIQIGSSTQADSGTNLFASVRSSNFLASGNGNTTKFTTSTGGTYYGVTGLQKVVLRSKPVITVSAPQGVLTNSLTEIIRITVGANTNPIALKGFGVNLTTMGVSVVPTSTSVIVSRTTDPGTNLTGSVYGNPITPNATSGDLYVAFANPETIIPGALKTYIVKVTPSGASSTPGTARITTQLDRNETRHIDGVPAYAYQFYSPLSWIWSDLSDDQTGIESNLQWANAYLIRPFPLDAVTVTN